LGGVVQALRYLGEQPFLLVSGDVFTDYPYRHLSEVTQAIADSYPRRAAHLVLVPNPPYHPGGDMSLSDDSISLDAPRMTYANIGVFHPRLFGGLTRGEKLKLFPWIYRFLGERRITGEIYFGAWHNLGTPDDLAELNEHLVGANNPSKAFASAEKNNLGR
jgi:MurNAc alpha-1-phosphate uridylyltransferase